jgi:uncharacterized repeat protein (TIGR01451 family)
MFRSTLRSILPPIRRSRPATRPTRAFSAAAILAAALLTGLAAPTPAAAQSVTIDTFATNQPSLTLTYPPSGTSASSSVSGAGILGGERDIQVNLTGGVIAGNTMSAVVSSGFFSYSQDATIAGNAVVQWDGTDGSPALNPTGLGGIDMTVGGTQDGFLLNTFFDDLPVNVTLTIYTDATHASAMNFMFPGLVFSATNFVLPYSAFTPTLGTGADFTNVGAVTLSLGSTVSAPDVVLDFLQTTAGLTAGKTVAILNDVNGDGMAGPGDTLRYTIVLTNPTDATGAAETGVTYANPVPANTALVVGSVTTTQGTVTAGNGSGTGIGVNVGTINDGGTVTITFDVIIDNPLPAGVFQITCQGVVTTPSLPGGVLTQGPGGGPTVIPVVAAPMITATKVATLVVDNNGNGLVNPGDTVQYTAVITNNGNEDASGVTFTSGAPTNTMLVVGSVTTTQGTVTTGNTAGNTSVAVNVGTVPGGGGTVTITFRVTVNNPLPPGVTQIACQGLVTGTNFPNTPTDNPMTPAPGDTTVTPIDNPPVVPIPTLDGWGLSLLTLLLLGFGILKLRRRTA